MRFRVLSIIFIGLLASISAFAQGTGVIRGRVIVPNSVKPDEPELVKGATVFLSETQSSIVTDASGKFEFVRLEPGLYHLSAGAPERRGVASEVVWLYRPGDIKSIVLEVNGQDVQKIRRNFSVEFTWNRYSNALKGLGEPFLCEGAIESDGDVYRFLYLRSFQHPIHITLKIQADGSGIVTVKRSDGHGGYGPGKLVEDRSFEVNSAMVGVFLENVEEADFWQLPPTKALSLGADGAQWILEGRTSDRCHFTDRWSPEPGAYRSLGRTFLRRIADLNLKRSEIY